MTVWSKYDEVHLNKASLHIKSARDKFGSHAISMIRDEVVEQFKMEGIVFCVDSLLTLFDLIWDQVGQEFALAQSQGTQQ